jgi:hypothetical protein
MSPENTSHEGTESDEAGKHVPGSAQPPRPQMSDLTPAPIVRPVHPGGAVKVARMLWLLSFAVGLVAVVIVFLSRDAQIDRLRDIVKDLEPDQATETLEAVATVVFWGSLGVVVIVIVIESLLLLLMMRGRAGARWALLFLVIVQAAAGVLASAFLVSSGGEGTAVFLLLAAALVLASAALVAGALPGAGTWFRAKHEARGHRPE